MIDLKNYTYLSSSISRVVFCASFYNNAHYVIVDKNLIAEHNGCRFKIHPLEIPGISLEAYFNGYVVIPTESGSVQLHENGWF